MNKVTVERVKIRVLFRIHFISPPTTSYQATGLNQAFKENMAPDMKVKGVESFHFGGEEVGKREVPKASTIS